MFKPVGSGVDEPTAPDRAANDEKTRRIAAPHSWQALRGSADTPWMYSLRPGHGGCRWH